MCCSLVYTPSRLQVLSQKRVSHQLKSRPAGLLCWGRTCYRSLPALLLGGRGFPRRQNGSLPGTRPNSPRVELQFVPLWMTIGAKDESQQRLQVSFKSTQLDEDFIRQVRGSLTISEKQHSPLLQTMLKFIIDCRTISSSPEMLIKCLLFFFIIFSSLIVFHFGLYLKHNISPLGGA